MLTLIFVLSTLTPFSFHPVSRPEHDFKKMDEGVVDMLVLQERCRKDPISYLEEYESQRRHFDALLSSARLNPSSPSPRLIEVSSFMGAVAHCYKQDGGLSWFVNDVATFLTDSGSVMDPDLRRSLVRLLGLLRARGSADPTIVIPLFFRLLECNDKALRRMLHGHIVSDIKRLNTSEHARRSQLQSFLFSMMEDPSEVLVKRTLHVLVDLFRKRIWNDAKCANMIASGCFHSATSVAVIASKFLLDSESKTGDVDDNSDEEDNDDEASNAKPFRDGRKAADMWKAYNMTNKKSTKKRKRMERVINRLTRVKTQETESAVSERAASHPCFEAMQLLNDPQDFAERLFRDLQARRKKEAYEIRLIFINLITRLIGMHRLILFNLYPFLQRYLHPSQPEVTRVLAYLTQACHDLVPSDVLHPILRGLADTFVSERSSPLSMASGINAIRAICSRVPLAILDEENENLPKGEQESPLLLDLVQYKSSKDKGVVMAARSLIALYREVQPGLLHKRDRGKVGSEAVQKGVANTARSYGEHLYATGVDGAELLEKTLEGENVDNDNDSELGEHVLDSGLEPIGDFPSSSKENCDEDDSKGGRIIVENTSEVENCQKSAEDVVDEGNEDFSDGDDGEECDGSDADATDGEVDIVAEVEAVNGVEDENEDEEEEEEEEDSNENGSTEEGLNSEKRLDTLKILSQEDYARIRAERALSAVRSVGVIKNTGKAVSAEDIQGPVKRERRTLEERLETVLEGRKGREKFGSRKSKNKGGGSTNKKKLKTKSNSMVIHKRRQRSTLSRRDKQIAKRRKRDYK